MIMPLLILIVLIFNFLIEDLSLLYTLNIVIHLSLLFYSFLKEKTIFRLIHVWIFSFIYLILFDGYFSQDELILEFGKYDVLEASQFLINSNLSALSAYFFYFQFLKTNSKFKSDIVIIDFKPNKYTFPLIFGMLILFFGTSFTSAIQAFEGGRHSVDRSGTGSAFGTIIAGISKSIRIVYPSLVSYYFKYVKKDQKSLLKSILWSLPIFIIVFLQGTRFPLLFSLLGFYLVHTLGVKIKMKNIGFGIILSLSMFYLSTQMINFRTFGIKKKKYTSVLVNEEQDFKEKYKGEGIIKANAMLVQYFKKNSYMYGMSSSTLLVFWIPRALWEGKPTFLAYWLIRAYDFSNVSGGHSISFSFSGDSYADFGFYGGIFFCLIFGVFLASLEMFSLNTIEGNSNRFNIILVSILFPFVFFAVRSFNTAVISMIGSILLIYLFKKTLLNSNEKK